MVAFTSHESGAVTVADSLDKNQLLVLHHLNDLWSLGQESGWRVGEHVLLTEVLPEALQMRSEDSHDGCYTPQDWFDRSVNTIHRMSEGMTDGLVDFEFMKAALKIAGFTLMTDVSWDDRYPQHHFGEESGQTHFLDETVAGRYMSQSFQMELKARYLIPLYTKVACSQNGALDAILGLYDDTADSDSVPYHQWLMDGGDILTGFDWKVENYLHNRLFNKRRSNTG